MTEIAEMPTSMGIAEKVDASLRRRYAAERRFQMYGIAGIFIALGFLAVLLLTIVSQGYTAFMQTEIRMNVTFDREALGIGQDVDAAALATANYAALVKRALAERFPDVKGRSDKRALGGLLSSGADFHLRRMVMDDPSLLGTTRPVWLPADDDVDTVVKGTVSAEQGRLKDKQIGWLEQLRQAGDVELRFNWRFFSNGDSREPELAGIWGAAVGSFYAMLVTLALSFPLGVATAVYLEEFAPKNRWTDLIEININNLAAVPSIVFGLLGLAVFLNFFGLPRSAPLVGGLVLTLMSLPTIIIAARAAMKAVPPSIREAAMGLGASRLQVVTHHVLPLAMPGVLTGTIIAMAQALGETAPLLMIGMIAFIVDVPQGPMDPSTVLPVQVYLWSDSPERAFVERTSAAIMVLLGFLALMNVAAVLLRKKFERRW